MEMEAIRGTLVRGRPPFRFRLADGEVVNVPDPKFLVLPPAGSPSQSIVLYFSDKKGFTIFDGFLVVAIDAAGTGVNGHAPHESA